MKNLLINILLVNVLFNFTFAQVKPNIAPLSISSSYNKETDIILNSIEPSYITIDTDHNIYQIEMELNEDKRYSFHLTTNNIDKNDFIYVINKENLEYIGPYTIKDKINQIITTDLIKASNVIIEFNNVNRINSSSFEISAVENSDYNQINIDEYYISSSTRDEPIIIVTGFWPPTNEMIRHFSQNDSLNPNGWQGDNWENRGYDIISYFPTFDDPDCSNCGQGYGDFEVDYQDTSEDFWPIFEDLRPTAIITFSRGYINMSWELENNYYNRTNWYNDYSSPFLPTPNPPDTDVDNYFLRNSNLPMQDIVNSISNLNIGLDPYIDANGDPGHFVSEFMGYHGVWYRDLNLTGEFQCISAGHVHVGGQIPVETARIATEETIRTLINYLDQLVYTPGDLNQDEIIDILDLVIIINGILGTSELTQLQTYASDINEDGIINIQDIILIINMILNN